MLKRSHIEAELYSSLNSKISCEKNAHNEKPIKYVCSSYNCPNRYLCELCMKNTHEHPKENLISMQEFYSMSFGMEARKKACLKSDMSLDKIRDTLLGKKSIFNKYFKLLSDERDSIHDELNQMENAISESFRDYRRRLNEMFESKKKEFLFGTF